MQTSMVQRSPFSRLLPLALFAAALGFCPIAWGLTDEDPARLNIVVIMADDWGQGDASCYNPDSRTPMPHVDRLAREGMRFTDAHSPSAVCTPTRYGLLTGRYAWRTHLKSGVLWNGYTRALIEPDRATLATVLRANGYHTAAIGKWHLGWDWASTTDAPVTASSFDHVAYDAPVTNGPLESGFAYSYLIPASLDMEPYVWLETDRVVEAPTDRTPGSSRRWSGGGGYWRAGAIAPGFDFEDVLPTIAEQSVAVIEQRATANRRGDSQPLFLYVPLASPHTPWVPTPEWQGATDVGWYGDFVTQTDWAIGRILAALDRTGMTDNTLVIVTSDNGSHWPAQQIEKWNHRANLNWRGQKADIYEGGHRVPFIVRWPGVVAPGAVTDQLACLTDIFATCMTAAGVARPQGCAPDSVDLTPVLRGEVGSGSVRDHCVHHSLNGTFAIRSGDWKLIVDNLGSGGFTAPRNVKPDADGPGGQLYNLAEDPGETTNVWNDHPEIVSRLHDQLRAIQ